MCTDVGQSLGEYNTKLCSMHVQCIALAISFSTRELPVHMYGCAIFFFFFFTNGCDCAKNDHTFNLYSTVQAPLAWLYTFLLYDYMMIA